MNRPKLSYTLRIIASLFLGLLVHQVYAQNKRIDSIRSVLDTVSTPRLHVNALNDLSTAYNFINADSSEYFVDKGLALAKEINYERGLAITYNQKGVVQYIRGNLRNGIIWLDSSLIYRKKIGDVTGELLVMNNKAVFYQNLAEYEKSKDMLFAALEVAKENDIKGRQAEINNNIAIYYSRINRFDSALYFNQRSLEINREINNKSEMSLVENNIGTIYFRRSQHQKALRHFKASYQLALSSGNARTRSMSSENIAIVYSTIGLHEKAIEWYLKLLEENKTIDNQLSKVSLMSNLSAAYLDSEQYDKAYDYAFQAIELKESAEIKYNIAKSYYIAGQSSKKLGDVEKSINLLNKGLSVLQEDQLQTESIINNVLGTIYFEKMDFDQAEKLFRRNLEIQKIAVFPDVLTYAYGYLAKLTSARNDYRKAFEYQQFHDSFRDTLINKEKANAIIRSAIEFDTERKELELELSQERTALAEAQVHTLQANRRTLISSLIGIGFLFLIILIWRFQIAKSKRLALTKETERLSLISENERLKSQELKSELELKHKEVLSQALQLAQKNEAILDLKDKLIEEVQERPNDTLRRTIQSLDGKVNLDKDWKAFRSSFEGVYESFFGSLKADFGELTPHELKLCALLKLDLSIKEMSNVLGISQEGVKKARYRIRKKLRLTDSPEKISSFLMKY
ncbi:tetratricopeptide repeat protein [Roseivirga misakiensis]|uniref:HTH luxR-type domain-containing protein n=1 Tax=Roseivirga misakiensis TaxID=1563681 RepID=A0A1E5T729_9BACT|nr:tetratricopeptide repeat protein [Roseivirga misakiensis]OEK07194.1 hypothetical protein BFP71_05950 [Roseivirga misakiensis]